MSHPSKGRESWDLNEFANRFGLRRKDVQEAVTTGLLHTVGGRIYLDDMLAYIKSRNEIEDLPSLLAHHAALQVRVMRLENIVKFVTDTIGMHQLAVDFTDDELARIIGRAKAGVDRLTDGYIAVIIDVVLALTDRDLRRMDAATGEPRSWRHLIFHLEDLDDRLSARTDLMGDTRFQALRNDLRMALSHLRSHAYFSLALTNPDTDPHELLGRLCQRASKVYVPARRTIHDIRRSLDRLISTPARSS